MSFEVEIKKRMNWTCLKDRGALELSNFPNCFSTLSLMLATSSLPFFVPSLY